MKIMLVMAALAIAALPSFASPLTVGTIPITGSGTYGCDTPLTCYFTVIFGGSAGSDSVSLNVGSCVDCGVYPDPITGFVGTSSDFNGTATIDGISGYFNVFLLDGGSLQIYSSPSLSGPLLASATLNGAVISTNYSTTGVYGPGWQAGTFIIEPTPDVRALRGACLGSGSSQEARA